MDETSSSSSKPIVSYIALAVGIVALLAVVVLSILYFVMKPKPPTDDNLVRFTIDQLQNIPAGDHLTNYTFSNQQTVKGVADFTLSSDKKTITYTGSGGWYMINIAANFNFNIISTVMPCQVTLLNYNGIVAQTISPYRSTCGGYTTGYNGSYLFNLKNKDYISLDWRGDPNTSINTTNTFAQQNYLSIQQVA